MATMSIREPLHQRVSWGALFAGFFFGFGVFLLLLALGAGVGFSAFNPRDLGNWQGLGIGFGIWGVLCGIVSMFLAGWLTARLGAVESRPGGMLHGAALWGFMLVAGLWIAAMAVTSTASAAASAAGTAAQAAGAASANPQTSQQLQQAAPQVRQQAQQLAQQAQANKGEAADAAKTAGATGAWAFFIYGVLTLAAAILGGGAGVPKDRRVVTREETVPAGPLSPQRV